MDFQFNPEPIWRVVSLWRPWCELSLDEKVHNADMVALAKEWHKKMGLCEDIHSCGCCGMRDFQQVNEVKVPKLEVLKLDAGKSFMVVGLPLSIASMLKSMNRTHRFIDCTMILYLMV